MPVAGVEPVLLFFQHIKTNSQQTPYFAINLQKSTILRQNNAIFLSLVFISKNIHTSFVLHFVLHLSKNAYFSPGFSRPNHSSDAAFISASFASMMCAYTLFNIFGELCPMRFMAYLIGVPMAINDDA